MCENLTLNQNLLKKKKDFLLTLVEMPFQTIKKRAIKVRANNISYKISLPKKGK